MWQPLYARDRSRHRHHRASPSRLTLQTLLRSEPGSALQDEIRDYLLIGNTRGEPFTGSFSVIKDNSYRRRLEDCTQGGTLQTSLRVEDEILYGQILEEAEGG